MKKFIFLVIFTLLLGSCSVPQQTDEMGLVRFQLLSGAKEFSSMAVEGQWSLMISIKRCKGRVVYEREIVELYSMGEGYISEPLSLKGGNYELTEFLVLNDEKRVIYATPIEDSRKAYLVDDPLPIGFFVHRHETTAVSPEVLSVGDAAPEDFGYEGFSFDVVETIVFKVEVYEWTEEENVLTEATMTVSSGEEELYFGELGAEMNEIEVRGEYDSYDVIIEKDDYEDKVLNFSNEELRGHFEDQLIVVFGENTFTIVYSGPYVNDNNEGDFEGTGIFTFDADGAPLSYEVVFKMRTGASAEAWRFLLTVTKWHSSGTTVFEKVLEYESELQFFELDDFDATVDDYFTTTSPDYEKWTTALDWVWDEIEQVSLLQVETVTVTENGTVTVVGKTMYYYNSDNLLELILEAEDDINFNNAEWFKYDAENDFPDLPIESSVVSHKFCHVYWQYNS